MANCYCGSNKILEECCLKFINGKSVPLTAEELMRSRYVAFVLKNKDYLLKTWFHKKALSSEQLFEDSIQWVSLEILETVKGQATDNSGVVEFKATFEKNGVKTILHERSEFKKESGLWFYTKGQHK